MLSEINILDFRIYIWKNPMSNKKCKSLFWFKKWFSSCRLKKSFKKSKKSGIFTPLQTMIKAVPLQLWDWWNQYCTSGEAARNLNNIFVLQILVLRVRPKCKKSTSWKFDILFFHKPIRFGVYFQKDWLKIRYFLSL